MPTQILKARRGEVSPEMEYVAKRENLSPELIRDEVAACLLYTSPSPRDQRGSRMPSSA